MAICNKTEEQLEEVYQRNLHCSGSFGKEESPELYEMCKNCENYTGCRQIQCFKNWLALEYLDWFKVY